MYFWLGANPFSRIINFKDKAAEIGGASKLQSALETESAICKVHVVVIHQLPWWGKYLVVI